MIDEMTSATAKILFHPLSWAHVDYHPYVRGKRGTEETALLNTMLIDLCRLPLSLPDSGTRIEKLLLRYWSSLPEVALMLCSYRYRDALMRKGNFTRLPAKVRQFALLSWGERNQTSDFYPDTEQLSFLSLQELLVWQQDLSATVIKRLPLLFPLSAGDTNLTLTPCYSDITLFEQAIQYAHFTSGTSFSTRAD